MQEQRPESMSATDARTSAVVADAESDVLKVEAEVWNEILQNANSGTATSAAVKTCQSHVLESL